MNHFLLQELAVLFAPHKIYLVGGTVRDRLLGRPSNDLDLATDAHPEESARILRQWGEEYWDPGSSYGTVCAKKDGMEVQVTTFRTEYYFPGDRHPKVKWGTNIETDLLRRDFTINALAQRIDVDGSLHWVGPLKGFEDIQRRIIRTPIGADASFGDDPLRLIRAARFQAQLPDFTVATETLEGMQRRAKDILNVAPERIIAELDKMLLAEDPFKGATLLEVAGVVQHILPEAVATPLLNTVPADLDLRWAAWLYLSDVASPVVHHVIVERALKRLKHNGHVFTRVPRILKHLDYFKHMEVCDLWSSYWVRKFKVEVKDDLDAVLTLARPLIGTTNWDHARTRGADRKWQRYVPQIDGVDIMEEFGIKQGREVGELLQVIQEAIYRLGPFLDKTRELAYLQGWRKAHL